MNRIAFSIENQQVKILVDRKDILKRDYLGVDPPRFFGQQSLLKGGQLLIGICTCGVEKCGDLMVNVTKKDNSIFWTNESGISLEFNQGEYESAARKTKNDHSWENSDRRLERLLTELFVNVTTRDQFIFDWVSARMNPHAITVSFSKNGKQKLLTFQRDKKSEDKTIENAKKFIREQLYRV
jgi:hypothetical protein